MLNKASIVFSLVLLSLLAGCSSSHLFDVRDDDLIEVSSDVTDELREKATRIIPKNSLILVGTLLNVNDLHETSAFGRIISDQIASSFHNLGYRIIGMEMPIDLFAMQEGGALYLPDDIKNVLKPYNPAVIVGGVYAVGKRNAYVSLRIVDLHTKNIISSTDVAVPMGPDTKKLLHSEKLHIDNANIADAKAAAETSGVVTPEGVAAPASEAEKPSEGTETAEEFPK